MKRFILFVSLIFLLSGCGYFVTKEEFEILKKQTYQLERDFKATSTSLTSEAGELKSTTARLDELHDRLRKSFAETNVRIDEIDINLSRFKGEFENFKLEVKDSYQKLETVIKIQNDFLQKMSLNLNGLQNNFEELKKDFSTFKNITSEISNLKQRISEIERKQEEQSKMQTGTADSQTKQQLYDSALELYNKGEFEKAINTFEKFLNLYPFDELSDNALYWIGESYYSQKKFNDALVYFHRVITDFPNADKVPSALYKEALTLEILNMDKEAEGAFKELIARFPYSSEAREAKKKLKDKFKK